MLLVIRKLSHNQLIEVTIILVDMVIKSLEDISATYFQGLALEEAKTDRSHGEPQDGSGPEHPAPRGLLSRLKSMWSR